MIKSPRLKRLCLIAAVLGLTGLLATAPSPAPAAQCLEHASMVKLLDKKFKETRRAFGLFNTAGLMELYVGEDGTWTVLLIQPSGISCIVAAGHTWEDLPKVRASGPAA